MGAAGAPPQGWQAAEPVPGLQARDSGAAAGQQRLQPMLDAVQRMERPRGWAMVAAAGVVAHLRQPPQVAMLGKARMVASPRGWEWILETRRGRGRQAGRRVGPAALGWAVVVGVGERLDRGVAQRWVAAARGWAVVVVRSQDPRWLWRHHGWRASAMG